MFATQQRSHSKSKLVFRFRLCLINLPAAVLGDLSLQIVLHTHIFCLPTHRPATLHQVGRTHDIPQSAIKADRDVWKLMTHQLEATPHCGSLKLTAPLSMLSAYIMKSDKDGAKVH